jgi:hypothetical protein
VSRTKTNPDIIKIIAAPVFSACVGAIIPAKKEQLKPTTYTTATISLLTDSKIII